MENLTLEKNYVANNEGFLESTLLITDPVIIKYLSVFFESERNEKILEALRVGVIAIQSASPTIDTNIVNDKFMQVQTTIDTYLNGFKGDLKERLEGYFKAESGAVPRSLDSFFGQNGTMSQMMNSYFSSDQGKLTNLIQQQVGPSSSFAKSLDPNNKDGVLSKLEIMVQTHLQEKTKEIINQFSLDIDNSALSRLQTSLFAKVGEIQTSNTVFFGQLKQALGIKEGKDTEFAKGTEKGREFESALYEKVAALAKQLGDTSENVRSLVGKIPRAKVGDYVLTLGSTSGAPETNIAIEVKKEQNYKLKDAVDELKLAKENREATAGIFIFAKGYEPAEVGDFHKIGNDFYVTVDEELLASNQPLLFFETAYKIIRILLVTSKRVEEAREVDLDKIKRELESVLENTSRISDIITKARTIKTNSDFILTLADTLKIEIEDKIKEIVTSI